MSSSGSILYQNIKNYLTEEIQRKSIKSISKKLIDEMETIYPKMPQQEDGSSCGLYALYFVKEIFKRVMTGRFNSMFDDISSWHQNKEQLVTMRYDLGKTISKAAVSQGYGDVMEMYFPTADATEEAFIRSIKKDENFFLGAFNSWSEMETVSQLPYQEYLRRQEDNQLDYSFIWSYDGHSSDGETS